VSGIFRPGQLVCHAGLEDDNIDLYSSPWSGDLGKARIIGHMKLHDVALVIAIAKTDGSMVYVLGSNGGGWAFGAFLRIVVDVK
jgi:hypothetical protein